MTKNDLRNRMIDIMKECTDHNTFMKLSKLWDEIYNQEKPIK